MTMHMTVGSVDFVTAVSRFDCRESVGCMLLNYLTLAKCVVQRGHFYNTPEASRRNLLWHCFAIALVISL